MIEENTKNINIQVPERFLDFILDWDYETYLALGGYGSGKSWNIAFKIILKCLNEKRKVLVARNVYETIRESCFELFKDILGKMNLLADEDDMSSRNTYKSQGKVLAQSAPMQLKFPNGSRIIFKGLDNKEKIKSIHGVSIVWIEECSEIKYEAYEELLGRIRTKDVSMHFILSCNPVGKENWVYRHFFKFRDDKGKEHTILDDEKLYEKHTLVKKDVYYHHSVPEDNPFLPDKYIRRLDSLSLFDPYLWRIAKQGRFGTTGLRVLPQFEVATNAKEFKKAVIDIDKRFHFIGFDFGFEESYNAVVKVAVDAKQKILYIYDEIYINHITDDKMCMLPEMQKIKKNKDLITADNEDPKAIQYYRQQGFNIRKCKKFPGSRLSNTRKVKRFKKIICSPKCKNTIMELRDLTYKKDSKGNVIYDEFNIDPHTFSAIWYALDKVNVSDYKLRKYHSKSGKKEGVR